MKRLILILGLAIALIGCQRTESPAPAATSAAAPGSERTLTIGIAFDSVQGGFWAAGFDALRADLKKRDFTAVEAVANGDANRQLEQVLGFINRRVTTLYTRPQVETKYRQPMSTTAQRSSVQC